MFPGSSASSKGYAPTSITYNVTPHDHTSAIYMPHITNNFIQLMYIEIHGAILRDKVVAMTMLADEALWDLI